LRLISSRCLEASRLLPLVEGGSSRREAILDRSFVKGRTVPEHLERAEPGKRGGEDALEVVLIPCPERETTPLVNVRTH